MDSITYNQTSISWLGEIPIFGSYCSAAGQDELALILNEANDILHMAV